MLSQWQHFKLIKKTEGDMANDTPPPPNAFEQIIANQLIQWFIGDKAQNPTPLQLLLFMHNPREYNPDQKLDAKAILKLYNQLVPQAIKENQQAWHNVLNYIYLDNRPLYQHIILNAQNAQLVELLTKAGGSLLLISGSGRCAKDIMMGEIHKLETESNRMLGQKDVDRLVQLTSNLDAAQIATEEALREMRNQILEVMDKNLGYPALNKILQPMWPNRRLINQAIYAKTFPNKALQSAIHHKNSAMIEEILKLLPPYYKSHNNISVLIQTETYRRPEQRKVLQDWLDAANICQTNPITHQVSIFYTPPTVFGKIKPFKSFAQSVALNFGAMNNNIIIKDNEVILKNCTPDTLIDFFIQLYQSGLPGNLKFFSLHIEANEEAIQNKLLQAIYNHINPQCIKVTLTTPNVLTHAQKTIKRPGGVIR